MAWAFNCQAQKLKPDELKGKWQRKHTTPGLASVIHTSPVYIFARIRPHILQCKKYSKLLIACTSHIHLQDIWKNAKNTRTIIYYKTYNGQGNWYTKIIMMNGNAIDKKLTCLSIHTCIYIIQIQLNLDIKPPSLRIKRKCSNEKI